MEGGGGRVRLTDSERALLLALDGHELTREELAEVLGTTEDEVQETLDGLSHNPDGSVRRFKGYAAVYASWRGMLPRTYRLNAPLSTIEGGR
jgi:hypothetical protein